MRVERDGHPVTAAQISVACGPEQMPATVEKTAVTAADGTLVLDGGTLKEPGFLRCIATVDRGGRPVRGLATAAFSPEKIKPTQVEPADFDAFWAKAKAELAALPIDARLTPMPEETTDKVEVFQVSLQNVSTPPSRSQPVLRRAQRAARRRSVPRDDDSTGRRHPQTSRASPVGRARSRHAEVGIHGIPGHSPGGALRASLRPARRRATRPSTSTTATAIISTGCYGLPAGERLPRQRTRSGIDKNLIDFGGSQGGYLSITTTALDPRVTACVVAFPAYCDVTGYVHGRAGGWPGPALRGSRRGGPRARKSRRPRITTA